jgi:prepilin-type N-terminal cleavage/methylation domain-containing protein
MEKMQNGAESERRSKAAFTLVELLVVVAIISMLAMLIFPAASKMRVTANKAKSLHQLKQIGVALTNYAADHKMKILPAVEATGSLYARGVPPEYRYWPIELADQGYLTYGDAYFSPLLKPGSAGAASSCWVADMRWKGHVQTYGMRRWVPEGRPWAAGYRDVPQSLAIIAKPENFFIVVETVWNAGPDQGTGCYFAQPGSSGSSIACGADGKVRTLFLDGHTEAVPEEFFSDSSNADIVKYSDGKVFTTIGY